VDVQTAAQLTHTLFPNGVPGSDNVVVRPAEPAAAAGDDKGGPVPSFVSEPRGAAPAKTKAPKRPMTEERKAILEKARQAKAAKKAAAAAATAPPEPVVVKEAKLPVISRRPAPPPPFRRPVSKSQLMKERTRAIAYTGPTRAGEETMSSPFAQTFTVVTTEIGLGQGVTMNVAGQS
jgi:hypothetical protein